jgi:glycosyltransferase involved in cell wall biosynthesis
MTPSTQAPTQSNAALGRQALSIAYVVQNPSFDLVTESPAIAITVKNVVRSLQAAGHRVDYFDLRGRWVNRVADMSTPEQVVPSALGLSGATPFRIFESGVRRAQRIVKGRYLALFDSTRFYDACLRALPGYDICHEHNSVLSVGAALACERLNIPYIITVDADPVFELEVQGVPLKGLQSVLAHWEARQTYRIARRVLCLSEATRQRLIEYWKVPEKKIVVLPLAADIDLFGRQQGGDEIRRSLGFGDEPVIGFVGSFQMWHGLEDLVESFARVRERFPNARLLFIGDGPGRWGVEERARKLNVQDAVTITGRVKYRDIPRYLAAADVVAAPYPKLKHEMWFSPLKLYEYMAAGKAIVATRCGQIPDVIQDGSTGLLVEPGDTAGFAHALCQLIADSDLRRRLGAFARRQAEARHSWAHLTERLEEIYRDVLTLSSRSLANQVRGNPA